MQVPEQYQGREQSYLKHRVLKEYLLAWGHKLGSAAQKRGRVRLCYVDGFAGPWQAKDADLADTSIAIGLEALETAAATWRDHGYPIDVDAYFVEKDPRAFASLDCFLKKRPEGLVRAQAYDGEFGTRVDSIRQLLGKDAGFIFVDPTGWKGAAMHFIAPLLADSPQRDALVNVMFDHINRFKDDPRQFLREQMREFFGLGDGEMPPALSEEELFALYRRQLKMQCGVKYAADLAIPHPTVERTKFRLVAPQASAQARGVCARRRRPRRWRAAPVSFPGSLHRGTRRPIAASQTPPWTPVVLDPGVGIPPSRLPMSAHRPGSLAGGFWAPLNLIPSLLGGEERWTARGNGLALVVRRHGNHRPRFRADPAAARRGRHAEAESVVGAKGARLDPPARCLGTGVPCFARRNGTRNSTPYDCWPTILRLHAALENRAGAVDQQTREPRVRAVR